MKVILVGIMTLLSINSFAYDGGLLKPNCIAVNIMAQDPAAQVVAKELDKLNIDNKRVVVKTISGEPYIRIIVMGKNGALKLNAHHKPFFRLNKDLESLLRNEEIANAGINFEFITIAECLETFNLF
ncbi:MAG: hypothetical protein Q7U04_05970 [Bacteriovorax sp.]|nr:hypothetical protein [Bacteriovorax sp.]